MLILIRSGIKDQSRFSSRKYAVVSSINTGINFHNFNEITYKRAQQIVVMILSINCISIGI